MTHIFKDGKAVLYSTSNVKILKKIVTKVNSNKKLK